MENSTGREYACKTIGKRLDVPNFSPQKQAAHLDNVKREVSRFPGLNRITAKAQHRQKTAVLQDNLWSPSVYSGNE